MAAVHFKEKEESLMKHKKLKSVGKILLIVLILLFTFSMVAFAEEAKPKEVEDMWTVANDIIVDVYNKIAAISTVLAGLMTAVCCIGIKLSTNQQKSDMHIDWLKKIWVAWAIINGIGAWLAYVQPHFEGLNHLDVIPKKE